MSSQEGGPKNHLKPHHPSLVEPIDRIFKLFSQSIVPQAWFLVNLQSSFREFVSCNTWQTRSSRSKAPSGKIIATPQFFSFTSADILSPMAISVNVYQPLTFPTVNDSNQTSIWTLFQAFRHANDISLVQRPHRASFYAATDLHIESCKNA